MNVYICQEISRVQERYKMIKIVYNSIYSGIYLSREAVLMGREISNEPLWGGPCLKGDVAEPWGEVTEDVHHVRVPNTVKRDDPVLVEVVERLGPKASRKPFSKLHVVDVPVGFRYVVKQTEDRAESITLIQDFEWES